MHNKPIDSMIKILDKLAQNTQYIYRYPEIFEQISKELLNHKDLPAVSVPIKARFLQKFAFISSQSQNIKSNDLITKLAEDIKDSLGSINEHGVLSVMAAIIEYQKLAVQVGKPIQALHALNFEMNNFVVKMAINQQQSVEVDFLVNYLDKIRKITVPEFKLSENLS